MAWPARGLIPWHVIWFLAASTAPLAPPKSPLTVEDLGHCPWRSLEAMQLAFDPPWPMGELNEIALPNDVKPGGDLTLTVPGEEDPYTFKVPGNGYGGRVVSCMMPRPPQDDYIAMTRAKPHCELLAPAKLSCRVSDMWLEGKGSPVHDLIHQGRVRDAVDLFHNFTKAQAIVDWRQWQVDLLKDQKKAPERIAKELVKEAKAANDLFSQDRRGCPGKCFPKLAYWVNATTELEERTKTMFKDAESKANAALERAKKKRDKVGGVEELTINDRDVWGRTPLHWAAARGLELMQFSNFGATNDPQNITLVAGVIEADWAWLVEELLELGAEPNMCDVDGRTPLDLAIASGSFQAVTLLLQAGSALDSRNRWEESPVDVLARQSEQFTSRVVEVHPQFAVDAASGLVG